MKRELMDINSEIAEIYRRARNPQGGLTYLEEAVSLADGRKILQQRFKSELEALKREAVAQKAVFKDVYSKVAGTAEYNAAERERAQRETAQKKSEASTPKPAELTVLQRQAQLMEQIRQAEVNAKPIQVIRPLQKSLAELNREIARSYESLGAVGSDAQHDEGYSILQEYHARMSADVECTQ